MLSRLSYRERVIYVFSVFFTLFPYRLRRLIKFSIDASLGYGNGGFDFKNEVKSIHEHFGESIDLICFDIGANRGEWARELLRFYPKAKVLCFEPDSTSIEIFKNLLLEFPNLTLHNIARSDYVGTAPLNTMSNLWGGASLIPGLSPNSIFTKDVQVDTIDNFVLKSGIQPNLIKIDVEGLEMSVLRGGIDTLKKVQVVEFEFSNLQMHSRLYFKDFFDFFAESGFKLGRITPAGLVRITNYDPVEEFFRTTNYIAYR
jgi:FkbM family methyltransferase